MNCAYKENEGCSLPSDKNDLKILVCQLKREVDTMIKDNDKELLKMNRKNCRECCIY